MIEIKRMADCTAEEKVLAWNTGFEGYVFDMTTTIEAFEKRGETEGLSDRLSLIAFEDGRPVGLVRNGVREWRGEKLAWNGGTGVAPSMRGKGVGRKMMEATIEILRAEGVHIATLEAVKENTPAIELYKQLGYKIVDEVHFMQLKGQVETNSDFAGESQAVLEAAIPEEAGMLPFYRGDFTWQTQWESVKDGEAIIAKDANGHAIGYAYYRKSTNAKGELSSIVLYQCEVEATFKNREAVAEQLILAVFDNFSSDINRVAVNIPVEKSNISYQTLEKFGFILTTAQVFMIKEL